MFSFKNLFSRKKPEPPVEERSPFPDIFKDITEAQFREAAEDSTTYTQVISKLGPGFTRSAKEPLKEVFKTLGLSLAPVDGYVLTDDGKKKRRPGYWEKKLNSLSSEDIKKSIPGADSIPGILKNLGWKYSSTSARRLKERLNEEGICLDFLRENGRVGAMEKISAKTFRSEIKKSKNYSELLRNLGISVNGGNVRSLKRKLERLGLDPGYSTYKTKKPALAEKPKPVKTSKPAKETKPTKKTTIDEVSNIDPGVFKDAVAKARSLEELALFLQLGTDPKIISSLNSRLNREWEPEKTDNRSRGFSKKLSNVSRKELEKEVSNNFSCRSVMRALNLPEDTDEVYRYTKVRSRINESLIDISHFQGWRDTTLKDKFNGIPKEDFQDVVEHSVLYAQVLDDLGLYQGKAYIEKLKKHLDELGVNYSHIKQIEAIKEKRRRATFNRREEVKGLSRATLIKTVSDTDNMKDLLLRVGLRVGGHDRKWFFTHLKTLNIEYKGIVKKSKAKRSRLPDNIRFEKKINSMSAESLRDLLEKRKSFRSLIRSLGFTVSQAKYLLLKNRIAGIKKSPPKGCGRPKRVYTGKPDASREEIEEAVRNSLSFKNVSYFLGEGYTTPKLKSILDRNKIDYSHILEFINSNPEDIFGLLPPAEILCEDIFVPQKILRSLLLKEKLCDKECSECSLAGEKSMHYKVYHFNGIGIDNSVENLKLVCVDCFNKLPPVDLKTFYDPKQRSRRESVSRKLYSGGSQNCGICKKDIPLLLLGKEFCSESCKAIHDLVTPSDRNKFDDIFKLS